MREKRKELRSTQGMALVAEEQRAGTTEKETEEG